MKEKRNSDIAFHEINRKFESQRFQPHQATRWADQAQRNNISLYGELELRNRLFQEDHARDCQEIEELRRNFCEETDRARQARIDELSLHQERNPTSVSRLLTQIQDFLNKVNSARMQETFTILNQRAASTHVPSRFSAILSPRTLPRCDSGLARDTQNCNGYHRKRFLNDHLLKKDCPLLSSTISKNLSSSSLKIVT